MQIRRQEIQTGMLVIVTVAIVTGVLLAIGAPGVFTRMKTYYVHFDNAGGIKPGNPVLLAGRKVGQVIELFSPVPEADRPADKPNYEALVEIRVSESARIYERTTVTLKQFGLLGEFGIDFTSGIETSGPAPENFHFIGVREPNVTEFMSEALATIKPVATEAKATLEQLRDTAVNLQRITAEDSDFDLAMKRIRDVGDNLAALSKEDGPLWSAIEKFQGLTGNLEHISEDLVEKDTINLTLENFRSTAARLEDTSQNLDQAIDDVAPGLTEISRNTVQLTDTLKRQPWRLLWPTTKKYPGDEIAGEKDQQKPLPVRRALPVRPPNRM